MMKKLLKIYEKEKVLAVGLMSGTSLDGVDAALVEITVHNQDLEVDLKAFTTLEYTKEIRDSILALCSPTTSDVKQICEMNIRLGQIMAQAVKQVIEQSEYNMGDIDFVSSHGQTIYHEPEKAATLQIGELAVIATHTGKITVGDFRPSDMAVGGQGAPLVPYTDYLLFRSDKKGRALINIGGISNISIIEAGSASHEVIAYDMGPGNMLIDAIMVIGTNGLKTYDLNGETAVAGIVNQEWLIKLMDSDAFLDKEPPKSTGREAYTLEFARELYKIGISKGLNLEDIVATITEYTVQAIVYHFREFIDNRYKIEEVLVSGGGVFNKTIMNGLQEALSQKVDSVEAWGHSSDAKEAISFALLGYEFLKGNCNNLPSATGASRAVVMGKLALPG